MVEAKGAEFLIRNKKPISAIFPSSLHQTLNFVIFRLNTMALTSLPNETVGREVRTDLLLCSVREKSTADHL